MEVEPLNRGFYGFDTLRYDPNPSLAQGCPGREGPFFCTGALYKGLDLSDRDTSHGYYHYYQPQDLPDRLNSNDWGTLSLITTIEMTSRLWGDYNSPCFRNRDVVYPWRFGAGDLSQGGDPASFPFFGGPWFNPDGSRRHESHQNGRDVDVRYLRKATHDTLPLDLASSDSVYYDPRSTADLVGCFLATRRVQVIYMDTEYARITNNPGETVIQHDSTHRNHFHVRIVDPDGESN